MMSGLTWDLAALLPQETVSADTAANVRNLVVKRFIFGYEKIVQIYYFIPIFYIILPKFV